MKSLSLGLILIVLATVFLLSLALPEDNGKDRHKRLIEPEESKVTAKSLQRRKPPGKIPGPKLTSEERNSEFLTGKPRDKESKMTYLSAEEERKKAKKDANLQKYKKNRNRDDLAPLDGGDSKNEEKNKHEDKSLTRGEKHNSDWKEETQEERSSIL